MVSCETLLSPYLGVVSSSISGGPISPSPPESRARPEGLPGQIRFRLASLGGTRWHGDLVCDS
jgi:hypothetical protein